METDILFHNKTYLDFVAEKPFGWALANPIFNPHYKFEVHDVFYYMDIVEQNVSFAFYAGIVYILTIFSLQKWMESRPAFDLRRSLCAWNAFLSLFSIVAFYRMLPGFIYSINQPDGVYGSLCLKTGLDIPSVFWGFAFALSKFVELGDTIFIVLRKRPLVFLQWFHHLATMTVCWITLPSVEPIVRWYTVLNTAVHSIMYPYFALKAAGVNIPTPISRFITTAQFSQMVIGFFVNMTTLYWIQSGRYCARETLSIQVFIVVYGAFIVLFGKLFYDSVVRGGRRKKKLL